MDTLVATDLGPNGEYIEVVDYADPIHFTVSKGTLTGGQTSQEAVPKTKRPDLLANITRLLNAGWTRSEVTAPSLQEHARRDAGLPTRERAVTPPADKPAPRRGR